MSSVSRRGPALGRSPAGLGGGVEGGDGPLARFSQSPIVARAKEAASGAATVAQKLFRSTGKAAWIAGTTFLILVVPLIIEMDREQQLNELEMQQASLLGAPPAPPPPSAAAK